MSAAMLANVYRLLTAALEGATPEQQRARTAAIILATIEGGGPDAAAAFRGACVHIAATLAKGERPAMDGLALARAHDAPARPREDFLGTGSAGGEEAP
jgi:hypothetical protein